MSWESPIEIIVNQIESAWMDETFRVIQKVGINVDRNELIKALQYDRKQYEKGYEDGRNDIIRCKDCKWYDPLNPSGTMLPDSCFCKLNRIYCKPDFFCADGERKTDE